MRALVRQGAVRRRLRGRVCELLGRREVSSGVVLRAATVRRRRLRLRGLLLQVRVSVDVLCSLRGCLRLRRVCLVLSQVLIVRRGILIGASTLRLRRNQTSVWSLRID